MRAVPSFLSWGTGQGREYVSEDKRSGFEHLDLERVDVISVDGDVRDTIGSLAVGLRRAVWTGDRGLGGLGANYPQGEAVEGRVRQPQHWRVGLSWGGGCTGEWFWAMDLWTVHEGPGLPLQSNP